MLLEEELGLVAQAKAGEQAAIGLLWDDITPKLYGYLVKTLKDRQLADDVLQDTWLKAINALESFRPKGVRFSAWLFVIARNECRQHWRKNGREVSIDEDNETQSAVHSPIELTNKITLDTVLAQLPIDDHEILCLRYISELSFNEIAHVLEISAISARVRTHRALKRANLILNK